MKLLLLVIALLVGEICLAEETTVPPKTKNGTGAGRYNDRHSDRHHNYRNRDHDDYGKHRRYRTPIVDDYICDLEATILVVSSKHHTKEEKSYGKSQQQYGENNGGSAYGSPQQQYGGNSGPAYGAPQQSYGGNGGSAYGAPQESYGNGPSYGGESSYDEKKPKRHEYATPDALRLKCSHIATHSEHDCQTCCQLSARRYHSVSKHEIFGFIIDVDEIKKDKKGYIKHEDKGYRAKRDADYGNQPAPTYPAPAPAYPAPAPTYPAPAPAYPAPAQSYPAPEASYTAPDYSVPSYPAPAPEYQEQPQAYSTDSGYETTAASAYSGKSHHHYGPPKDARCVCCSPKRHHNDHHKRRDYGNDYSREDRYDRSEEYSREY